MKINRIVTFTLIFLCMLVAASRLPPARASGPIYIRADGTVDPPGSPIQRNGDLYTLTYNITSSADGIVVEKSNIAIDGAGFTVQGSIGGNAFYVYGVNNVTIRNARTEGFSYGIYLESTSRSVIYRNNLTGSTYDGLGLYDTSNSTVSFNQMKDNSWSGIGLYFSTDNNISGNCITDNYYGVNSFSSENNSIFHNDFVNNSNQTSSDGSPNFWDHGYPSGGNYWSDYDGSDVKKGPNQDQPGSDGIGDTPYNCDENNTDAYPLMQPWTNTAVAGVSPSKTVVGQGYTVYIRVTVQNEGWNAVTTKLTVYANTTILSTITNLALAASSVATLNITWQTTSVAKGNYVVSATADPVPNEPDTRDNTLTCGNSVVVAIAGDITGNGIVDIFDAILLARAFNSVPTSPNWNANADIRTDDIVDIFDAIILASNFNKIA